MPHLAAECGRIAIDGQEPTAREALELVAADLDDLLPAARAVRTRGFGVTVTYSPKVFIPLTHLCRDVCHYCTFARPPKSHARAYLTPDEVLEVARAGARAGCREALFTLGDKPERRYAVARRELAQLGCETTVEYLAQMCALVLDETGMLPHVNAGVTTAEELTLLRPVSASHGLMLESTALRLCERGGPHFGSPDKHPDRRIATIAAAGEAAIPFTTGLLVGIGETRAERIETLLAIRDLHRRFGHIQEVIVQSFRTKPGTRMAGAPEPSLEELLWTVATARLVLPSDVALQCPPNLTPDACDRLLDAGINDWGGVSPVTVDHVNPEAPWPELQTLAHTVRARGLCFAPRLAVHPRYVVAGERWLDRRVMPHVLRGSDADGLARTDDWTAGAASVAPRLGPVEQTPRTTPAVAAALAKVREGVDLEEADVVALLRARDHDLGAVLHAADGLRREVCGDAVSYVVSRNINYTNVCYFRCGFCAFSKGKLAANLRGAPYLVPLEEIVRRSAEAWERGAVEVCLQGGIHPGFTGQYYLDVCQAIKAEVPNLHLHAFSALEIWQGAATLGLALEHYLARLREAGLGSLPGTAAEVLDDEVRAQLCPDKISTQQWLEVHDRAHATGLRSTTTIMYGHVDRPWHWARHLLRLRTQQRRSGGFTEFVPLPFVHMEAPISRRGGARPGPTFREAILMHAVGRLALHPAITNIQASWVKLGFEGAKAALRAGANDLGGTLMNESISRAAGARHGQEAPPERLEAVIRSIGRTPAQRTTVYATPPRERIDRSFGAPPLAEPHNPPARDAELFAPRRLVRPGLVAA